MAHLLQTGRILRRRNLVSNSENLRSNSNMSLWIASNLVCHYVLFWKEWKTCLCYCEYSGLCACVTVWLVDHSPIRWQRPFFRFAALLDEMGNGANIRPLMAASSIRWPMIQPGQALTDKNSKHVQILQMKRQRAYWAEAKSCATCPWYLDWK